MFFLSHKQHKHRGFGLVEVLIGAAILSAFISAIVLAFQYFLTQSFDSVDNVQASFLAEEGIEAVKFIRDQGYVEYIATLDTDTPYFLAYDQTWNATTTKETYIDGMFERSFVLHDVYRDGSDDIAESGSLDPNTKEVTVFVSYAGRSGTTTTLLSTYITNFHD